MALLAFCRHGDQRTLNSLAVNGFLLLLALPLPLSLSPSFSCSLLEKDAAKFYLKPS